MKLTIKTLVIASLAVAIQAGGLDAQQTRSRNNVARTTATTVQLSDQTNKYLIQEATPTQPRTLPTQPSSVVPQAVRQTPVPMSGYQAPMTSATLTETIGMPAPMMQPTAIYDQHAASVACDCGQSSCQRCRLRGRLASRGCTSCGTDCGSIACPRCEGDVCKLELDNSKVKKTCFQVEQVPVCIPPVRFPWQKDCPPGTSKTRLVTKLKTHKYECPNCAYKWTLQKAEASASTASPTEAPLNKATEPEQNAKPEVQEEKVPRAPILQGAFRTWGRRR